MHLCRAAALLSAALVWALVMVSDGCGGPDLAVNGSLPATATPEAGTPTPGICSEQGQACDDVTLFCCTPFNCVSGGVCE